MQSAGEEFRRRYSRLSVGELEDLSSQGREAFREDAWAALQAELDERKRTQPVPKTRDDERAMKLPERLELYAYMVPEALTKAKNFFTRRRIESIAITLILVAGWQFGRIVGLLAVVLLAMMAHVIAQMLEEMRRNWRQQPMAGRSRDEQQVPSAHEPQDSEPYDPSAIAEIDRTQ